MSEQIIIFSQIVFIDLILAGDNAIIIGMVASKFPPAQRKNGYFLGYRGSSNFKNYPNSYDSLFITDNWLEISRWNSFTLYCL